MSGFTLQDKAVFLTIRYFAFCALSFFRLSFFRLSFIHFSLRIYLAT